MKSIHLAVVAVLLLMLSAAPASARDQIRVVGSSTVFPFATAVAEQFGKTTKYKTPVIESTGSGGGFKLFCAGVGLEHPDITDASRRIKRSEVELCARNGVTEIVEIKIGYDGIVVANAKKSPQLSLTEKDLFLALAKEVPVHGELTPNPNRLWSDVNPSLPAVGIEVLGPPPTSGTRDAFVELAMEGGAEAIPELAELRAKDKKAFARVAHAIREDGAYIEAGENDNLIVQKLEVNPSALGIFGFSFLDQNADRIQGSVIQGVEPTFENIATGRYAISRSLYFYVKKAHVGLVPGLEEYIAEFTSEKAFGDDGYLADKGLIPLPAKDRERVRNQGKALSPLEM